MNVWKNNIIWQSAAKTLRYYFNDIMGKVQRLSRKRVGFERIRSGGHPKKDEDIVCAYAKVWEVERPLWFSEPILTWYNQPDRG